MTSSSSSQVEGQDANKNRGQTVKANKGPLQGAGIAGWTGFSLFSDQSYALAEGYSLR